jgi:putative ABC transport system substrate-binding protein
MRRREFIAALGGAAGWPFVARAQQVRKLPTVGYLDMSSRSTGAAATAVFLQRLRELGWREGRTVAIEFRWADGHGERIPEIAAEFVRLKVDLIVTSGGAVPAVKKATSDIPIVFAIATEPLRMGLVASLARPGGNVTGLSIQASELASKRIELFRQAVPSLRRLAIMGNAGYAASVFEMDEAYAAVRRLGLEVAPAEIRRAADIEPAFERLRSRADALYLCSDALVNDNRNKIATSALAAHLPTVSGFREYVEAGGMMSYGTDLPDLYRRAAELVDKILRGARPADIPVEQPTKFDLVINMKTAKALGLNVPFGLLNAADEVIE